MKALRAIVLVSLATGFLANVTVAQSPERAMPRPLLAAFQDGHDGHREAVGHDGDHGAAGYDGRHQAAGYDGDHQAVGYDGNHEAVGYDAFYNHLSPYGHWVNRPRLGWGWAPGRVRSGWRPYSVGHWAYSDYGWTWVSAEPWGWATYHYGRWDSDPEQGWTWTPGSDWAPAWVSWQQGGDYIGWAPLPSAIGWTAGVGLAFGGVDLGVAIAPSQYCFVGGRNFLAANIAVVAVPFGQNAALFGQTRNITRYDVVGNRIVNGGLPVERVQQFTGRPVPRFTVASATRPTGGAERGNQLSLYRPAVARTHTEPPAAIQRDAKQYAAAHQRTASGMNRTAQQGSGAQASGARAGQPARTTQGQQAVAARSQRHATDPPAAAVARQQSRDRSPSSHSADTASPSRAAARPARRSNPPPDARSQARVASRPPQRASSPAVTRPQPHHPVAAPSRTAHATAPPTAPARTARATAPRPQRTQASASPPAARRQPPPQAKGGQPPPP